MTFARPGHDAIRLSDHGEPWIEGYRCDDCRAAFAAPTLACPSCGSRSVPQGYQSKEYGILHTWSVVERSYPGVPVPFVSAIVDLEDGLTLKGTVRASPASLSQGMPLELVFDDAGGAHDAGGAPYVGFHFVPAGEHR